MKIIPMADRIVVKRIEPEEESTGGIVLPDSAKPKPQHGKVLAVGPGRLLGSGERHPLQISVGDTVLFGVHSGSEVQLDDQELLILKEADILACLGFPGDPTTLPPPPKKK
jgi:chaperonin GroES